MKSSFVYKGKKYSTIKEATDYYGICYSSFLNYKATNNLSTEQTLDLYIAGDVKAIQHRYKNVTYKGVTYKNFKCLVEAYGLDYIQFRSYYNTRRQDYTIFEILEMYKEYKSKEFKKSNKLQQMI